MPPANCRPKQQRIPKSQDALLAVRTHVREKRARNERVAAPDYSIIPSHLWLALSGMRRVCLTFLCQ